MAKKHTAALASTAAQQQASQQWESQQQFSQNGSTRQPSLQEAMLHNPTAVLVMLAGVSVFSRYCISPLSHIPQAPSFSKAMLHILMMCW